LKLANLAFFNILPQHGHTTERDCIERWPLLNSSINSRDNKSSFIGGVIFLGLIFLPSICQIVLKDLLINQGHFLPD